MDENEVMGLAIGLWGAALVFFFYYFCRAIRKRRISEDTPTSKTTGVFIGQVELKGTAETEAPLTSQLAGQPTVWYRWSVQEQWRRQRVVQTTNSKGEQETKTVVETGWTPVGGGGAGRKFYLKDDCGTVQIDPTHADIEASSLFFKTCGALDPIYFKYGPAAPIPDSTGVRQFSESGIPLHQELYVLGHARLRDDAVAPELAQEKGKPLTISVRSEESIVKGYRVSAFFCGLLFPLTAGGGVGYYFETPCYGIYTGLGAFFLTFLVWAWQVHRSAVELRNRALQAKSNLDVELQRRHTLIGSLVQTVRGICEHEKEVMTHLAEIRTQYAIQGTDDAGKSNLAAVSQKIAAVAESYPNLKSDQNFLNLQKNLSETEQRIALARQYYNDSVEYVNNRRELFPEGYIARITGLRKMDYLQAEDFEKAAVKIEL